MDEHHIKLTAGLMAERGEAESVIELTSALMATLIPKEAEGRIEGSKGFFAEIGKTGSYEIRHSSDPNSRFPVGYTADKTEHAVRVALQCAEYAYEMGVEDGFYYGAKSAQRDARKALGIFDTYYECQ